MVFFAVLVVEVTRFFEARYGFRDFILSSTYNTTAKLVHNTGNTDCISTGSTHDCTMYDLRGLMT